MKLNEIYSTEKKSTAVISFEVFPPAGGFDKLDKELEQLKKFSPALISVTSTSAATNLEQKKLVDNIQNKLKTTVMPHLTCVRNSKEDVELYLSQLQNSKTDCILALRGDIPTDGTQACTDFKYANELVEFIKSKSDLSVGVAGYPEGHIESSDIQHDIKNLKKKINAGGEVIYTQLFFDNEKFFKYCELLCKEGINTPVAAGIMPVISYKQISRMIELAKISVPPALNEKIEKYKDDKKSMREFGIEYASAQCQSLIKFGVNGLHFYTLNLAHSTVAILDNIL